jgi:2-methylisocitrate lyase-like PEP mutase family enzyme
MSKSRRLRALLRERAWLATPGITAALCARIEKAGFEYVYAGGYRAVSCPTVAALLAFASAAATAEASVR